METIHDDAKIMAVRITGCTYPSGPFDSIDVIMADLYRFGDHHRFPLDEQQWQEDWQQVGGRKVVSLAKATTEAPDPVNRETQHQSTNAVG
jgi:hypothetical protein